MNWHDFIFSEKAKPKLLRHLAFWACWWLYFLLIFLLYQQLKPGFGANPFFLNPGNHLPVKTFLLVLSFAMACYSFLYFIFPNFIARNWLKAFVYLFLLCVLVLVTVHFIYWTAFPYINSLLGSSGIPPKMNYYWPAVNLGLLNFAKIVAAAAIIKYVKYWWLKQQESQHLEKEKVNAELQLLKAQVQPDFLLKTLTNIYNHALSASPRTSGMLLKLSDLLSYMLYECDQSSVPLDKEVGMMKEYMQLEIMRHTNEPEIEINIKGDLADKKIAPFLLLPFLENSFKHWGKSTEQSWINLDIRAEGKHFAMKLIHGPANTGDNQVNPVAAELANVQKRLALLYPGKYELKMVPEQEMFIVLLNLNLDQSDRPFDERKTAPASIAGKTDPRINLTYAAE